MQTHSLFKSIFKIATNLLVPGLGVNVSLLGPLGPEVWVVDVDVRAVLTHRKRGLGGHTHRYMALICK